MLHLLKKLFSTSILGHILKKIWQKKGSISKHLFVDYYLGQLKNIPFMPAPLIDSISRYLDTVIDDMERGTPPDNNIIKNLQQIYEKEEHKEKGWVGKATSILGMASSWF